MPKEYSREQLWKLYERLPEEIQELIFSEKAAETINDVCQGNKVPENKIPEVAKFTGRVLLGLLPPAEFEDVLAKELKIRPEVAKKVAREIGRFIFFPAKEVLSQLYEVEIAPPARPQTIVKDELVMSERERKTETSPKNDSYRESIE